MERSILTGASLRGSYLAGVNLDEAVMHISDFSNSNLSSASLKGADFQQARLCSTIFAKVHATNVKMFYAHLEGAIFVQGDLSRSDLSSSFIQGANFSSAKLEGCKMVMAQVGHYTTNSGKQMVTKFESNSFLPRYSDIIKRIVQNKLKVNSDILELKSLFLNRWFFSKFLSVRITDANTTLASDLRKYIDDQQFLQIVKKEIPLLFGFWNFTTACGWSSSRLMILTTLILILPFAFLYDRCPSLFVQDYANDWHYQHILASVGTIFNTENLAAKPASTIGKLFVLAENILGWIALGLSITIFANKYARRS